MTVFSGDSPLPEIIDSVKHRSGPHVFYLTDDTHNLRQLVSGDSPLPEPIASVKHRSGPHVFYSTDDTHNLRQFVSGDSPQKGGPFGPPSRGLGFTCYKCGTGR